MKNTYILNLLKNSIKRIYPEIETNISLEIPKTAEHGDISTNVAMQLAKILKKNPLITIQILVFVAYSL